MLDGEQVSFGSVEESGGYLGLGGTPASNSWADQGGGLMEGKGRGHELGVQPLPQHVAGR